MTNPFDEQIGGDHYKKLPFQPVEYIVANGMNFCEGNVVKYVTRYKLKNNIEDLEKAKHYLELLIEQRTRTKDKGQPHNSRGWTILES